ncbi:MAG: hypothetical protein EBU90_07630 [Proteobacteria bacterium]|nr:hypothetical protein [Pseudomonadota bacterium]NBP13428.1 hypothetical protein [bacterium]
MTTVNPYFQSGRTIGRSSEHNLYEDLVIECMKIYGFEVYYLPRKKFNEDLILGEDPLSTFEFAYPIEMYLENVTGFEGDGELMTKFGLELRDTARFVVARRRWNEVAGRYRNTILETRPAEGDLIYFPLTESYFEIRKVEGRDPFFQVGKLFVFKMDCELFQYSSERVQTGIVELDSITDNFSLDYTEYIFNTEDGNQLILEYDSENELILESYEFANVDVIARNTDFNTNISDILDFTERNPFGEIV